MGRSETDGLGVLYKVWGIGDDRYDFRYFTGPQRQNATKGKYFQGVPNDKLEADEITRKVTISNFYDFASNFGNCRHEGGVEFRSGKKPEILLELILKHFSNQGDIILDSFLGSGTTVAVAQKMNRRYIGIEMGEQCHTHCIPRLKAVIDGEQTGVSQKQNWVGGGGFKFYELSPTLIIKDKHGNPVINDKYNAQMLVAAIAKLNGYFYSPDNDVFWKQGKSQEDSYIFVTTTYLTSAMLDGISQELQEHERLLICASAFDSGLGMRYENINIRKIPQSVLDKCEYGVDDYNLNIIDPPELDEEEWEDFEDA